MAEFKLTIADPKTGKCVQRQVEGDAVKNLIGLKIGDNVKGEVVDLPGYEFELTGGSDFCGFPMRKGIQGARKRVLIGKGVGFKGGKKGIRRRKTVCGEVVNNKIVQINLKIIKKGTVNLFEKKEEAPKAEGKAPAEKSAEAPKEVPKEKEKPEEKTPSEEPKPETPKAEEKK